MLRGTLKCIYRFSRNWFDNGSAVLLFFVLFMSQTGKKQWAADKPLSLLLNMIGGLLTATASFMALFWPFAIVNALWAIISGYNFARVLMDRRDIRIAAVAEKPADKNGKNDK